MENKGKINYLSGIAEGTGLYHSSVARVLEPLIDKIVSILEQKTAWQQQKTTDETLYQKPYFTFLRDS